MKTYIPIALILITLLPAPSQTTIQGGSVSGLWEASGSPYLIQGSIYIPKSTTLHIEPGCRIVFQGTYKLLVQGQLLAIGSAKDSIYFTAPDTVAGWRGIRIETLPAELDSTIIDYCSITYGRANGIDREAHGGGIFVNNYDMVRISNTRIQHCSATGDGGAIAFLGTAKALVRNCNLSSNTALAGGAIACVGTASSTITDNLVVDNSGTYGGGGGICTGSGGTIYGNTISRNYGGSYGGGGIRLIGGNAVVSNNVISYNTVGTGYEGGGIYCEATATIISNTIANNSAAAGGGIYCDNNTQPSITNNVIVNNLANGIQPYEGGGGVYFANSTEVVLTNNTICNNAAYAVGNGGGIHCKLESSPMLVNCILFGNTATNSGAQVYVYSEDCDPEFYNCNIQDGTAAFGVNFNIYTGVVENTITLDPMFIASSAGSGPAYDGVSANWNLHSSSPCVNAGVKNNTYPPTDRAGNPRIVGSAIDIGAYEQNGTTDINEQFEQQGIVVYPNPSVGYMTLQSEIALVHATVTMCNELGQVVMHAGNISGYSVTLDHTGLPRGMYLIRVTEGSTTLYSALHAIGL